MRELEYGTMTNEELLERFVETRDGKLKQELVLRYSYIVKSIAMQMRGVYASFAEIDDMINEGIIALMGALDKFDPEKNVKFSSYASLRIRGAVIDTARKQGWVPRNVRKFSREMDDASNLLFSQTGRAPTEQEIAEEMGMPLDKYQKELGKTGLYHLLSLDALMDEAWSGSGPSSGLPTDSSTDASPTEHLKKTELYSVLREAIEGLRPREQMVISLYYRKELNMKEIARVLGVSEPRVSQILSGALRKLRDTLGRYMDDSAGEADAKRKKEA